VVEPPVHRVELVRKPVEPVEQRIELAVVQVLALGHGSILRTSIGLVASGAVQNPRSGTVQNPRSPGRSRSI
jgi:hypothetical protein